MEFIFQPKSSKLKKRVHICAAYNDAAGRPAGTGANLDLGNGALKGDNLAPGTYTWSSFPDVDINGDITLTGTATDVWIFQIPGTLILESSFQVNLADGALAQNIFWQVAGDVTIHANAHLEGIIRSDIDHAADRRIDYGQGIGADRGYLKQQRNFCSVRHEMKGQVAFQKPDPLNNNDLAQLL